MIHYWMLQIQFSMSTEQYYNQIVVRWWSKSSTLWGTLAYKSHGTIYDCFKARTVNLCTGYICRLLVSTNTVEVVNYNSKSKIQLVLLLILYTIFLHSSSIFKC